MNIKFLNFCDLFGKVPTFYIRSYSSYPTYIGLFFTLFVVFCVSYSSFSSFLKALKKENINVLITSTETKYPERTNLTNSNFILTIALQHSDYNNFIDESIYTLNGIMKTIIRDKNGNIKETTKNINIIKCSEYYFEKLPEYFNLLDLNNTYCLDLKPENGINFEGEFGQNIWSTIELYFRQCSNKSDIINSTNFCKTSSEINEILYNGYIGISFLDYSINTNDYKDPIKMYGHNIFTSFKGKDYQELFIYFKQIEVITDKGFIWEKKETIKGYSYERSQNEDFDETLDSNFIRVILGSSHIKDTYFRSYKKLDVITAEIGGISKVCLIIGKIGSFIIREFLYKNYLLRFFYDSENKNLEKNKKIKILDIASPHDKKKPIIEILKRESNQKQKKQTNENSKTNFFFESNDMVNNINLKKNKRTNQSKQNEIQKNLLNINFENQKSSQKCISKVKENKEGIFKNEYFENVEDKMINNFINSNFTKINVDNKELFQKINTIKEEIKTPPTNENLNKYKLNTFQLLGPCLCSREIQKKLSLTIKLFNRIEYLFDVIYYLKLIDDINIIKKKIMIFDPDSINDFIRNNNNYLFQLSSTEDYNKFCKVIKS